MQIGDEFFVVSPYYDNHTTVHIASIVSIHNNGYMTWYEMVDGIGNIIWSTKDQLYWSFFEIPHREINQIRKYQNTVLNIQ